MGLFGMNEQEEAAVMPLIGELIATISDVNGIAAELNHAARCNLAARFVVMGEKGPVFFAKEFEHCHNLISEAENAYELPENDKKDGKNQPINGENRP